MNGSEQEKHPILYLCQTSYKVFLEVDMNIPFINCCCQRIIVNIPTI